MDYFEPKADVVNNLKTCFPFIKEISVCKGISLSSTRRRNLFFFFFKIFIFSIIVGLQCSVNFLLYSKVTQYVYIHTYSFSHIILHHVPLQVTRYSSLCYTPGSHCLSTPYAIVWSNSKLQSIPFPPHPPWQPQICSPSPCTSFLWKGSFVPYIRLQEEES